MQVYKEEMAAQKVLYRGFGTQKPGGMAANFMDFRDKPVANTSMLEWGGKLYALWEAHNPFVLDPNTLETLGEETFGSTLLTLPLPDPIFISCIICKIPGGGGGGGGIAHNSFVLATKTLEKILESLTAFIWALPRSLS